MNNPFVSIIVPCRNEENYIQRFLDSVILQNYPKDHLEFLIADGSSEDGTREIILEYTKKYPFISLIDNTQKYTPVGLNLAIQQSKGDIVIRLDCHATYPADYIAKCVQYLAESKADNVGGVIKTMPAKNTLEAKAIALCMSHGFSVGNSHFRKGALQPKEVDTVFGGCYKKDVFKRVGLFNEKLTRSQDLEFNLRLKKAGGKIMLFPDIISYYYPKSTFREFLRHNLMDGLWAILPLKYSKTLFKPRHYLPLVFFTFFLVLFIVSFFSMTIRYIFLSEVTLYLLTILLSSTSIAMKEKDFGLLFYLPTAFFIRSFGYGFGSFAGMIKLLI